MMYLIGALAVHGVVYVEPKRLNDSFSLSSYDMFHTGLLRPFIGGGIADTLAVEGEYTPIQQFSRSDSGTPDQVNSIHSPLVILVVFTCSSTDCASMPVNNTESVMYKAFMMTKLERRLVTTEHSVVFLQILTVGHVKNGHHNIIIIYIMVSIISIYYPYILYIQSTLI